MSWTVHVYDLSGLCCRFGVWWVAPGWTLRYGARLFVRLRVVGRRYRYEEVCG